MNRLKELRTNCGITQEQLAKDIGCSLNSIYNWESEKRQMSYDILLKFSQYFNVTIDYLLGNSRTNEFAIAFYNQVDSLSKEDKEKVIEYARLLKIAENRKS